jgi:hypothetical protein
LKLHFRPDDDEFQDAVIEGALGRVKPIVECAKPTNGEELVAAIADHFGVHFEPVRTHRDLDRIRDHYCKVEGQLGFIQLDKEFQDPRVDALLFQLTPRSRDERTRYVAVLNLLRTAHREFWDKIHELTHRVIEPPQKLLPFRRHPAERTRPIEQLVDLVAAEFGFYRPLFVPFVRQAATTAALTWETVRTIKSRYAPSASLLAVANAAVKCWRNPAIVLEAAVRGKRGSPSERVGLRVDSHARNAFAKTRGLFVFPNMCVPPTSPLYAAYHEHREISDWENLGTWCTSRGVTLQNHRVLTSAVGFRDRAYAILSVG